MEWIGLIIISTLFVAMHTILKKNILKKEHTFEYTLLVYFVCFIFTGIIIGALSEFNVPQKEMVLLIAFRGILAGSGFLLISKAYKHSDISLIAPLQNFTPVILIFLGLFILGESVSIGEFIGISIMVFGAYLLSIKKGNKVHVTVIEMIKSKVFMYVSGTLVLWSFSILIERHVMSTTEISSFMFLLISFFAGFIWLLIIYLLKFRSLKRLVQIADKYGIYTIVSALLLVIAMTLKISAFTYPAAKVAIVSSISKFATVIEVVIGGRIFHESNLNMKTLATMIMIAGAIVIMV